MQIFDHLRGISGGSGGHGHRLHLPEEDHLRLLRRARQHRYRKECDCPEPCDNRKKKMAKEEARRKMLAENRII